MTGKCTVLDKTNQYTLYHVDLGQRGILSRLLAKGAWPTFKGHRDYFWLPPQVVTVKDAIEWMHIQ